MVDGDMVIVYDKSSMYFTCYTSDLVIDLGDSFHVNAYHDYVTFYANDDCGNFQMGNEGASKIVGIEEI